MENRQALNIESTLPEEIIHHIQSFLNEKQSARTSILSKSWYNAWFTRPHLDFDQQGFSLCYLRRSIKFIEIVEKTLQRYEESNLNIQSFRLHMTSCDSRYHSLIKNLVVKAIRIGAINLDLGFFPKYMEDVFILPCEVLESETLTSLSLRYCRISLVADRKVRCSSLKSLNLRYVCLEGGIIWDILSGCPLIEKLVIYGCTCLCNVENSGADWKLSLGPSVNPYEFQRLKCLQLEKVHINTLFFVDFSSKFPCLKDLIIKNCSGFEEIVVSSHSLECISFKLPRGLLMRATFDVPSICDFYFVGSCLSSLTFETISKELKCDLSIEYDDHSTSWFTDLKNFLRNLSLSRIYLRINNQDGSFKTRCDYACDDQGLPTPVVEDLMLSIKMASSVPSTFLYGLFQSCHPKFLTLNLSCFMMWKAHSDLVNVLYKTMMLEVSENCLCVKVESLKNRKWQTLPWKTLLDDALTIPGEIQKLRFQLRWER